MRSTRDLLVHMTYTVCEGPCGARPGGPKEHIYANVDFTRFDESTYVGLNAEEARVKITEDFAHAVVSVYKPGEEWRAAKIVEGRKATIESDADGKVLRAYPGGLRRGDELQ